MDSRNAAQAGPAGEACAVMTLLKSKADLVVLDDVQQSGLHGACHVGGVPAHIEMPASLQDAHVLIKSHMPVTLPWSCDGSRSSLRLSDDQSNPVRADIAQAHSVSMQAAVHEHTCSRRHTRSPVSRRRS